MMSRFWKYSKAIPTSVHSDSLRLQKSTKSMRATAEPNLQRFFARSATVDDVRGWRPGEQNGEVYWQDLSLRTHRNVRTGDVIHEW
jgi:hypothetical protein